MPERPLHNTITLYYCIVLYRYIAARMIALYIDRWTMMVGTMIVLLWT